MEKINFAVASDWQNLRLSQNCGEFAGGLKASDQVPEIWVESKLDPRVLLGALTLRGLAVVGTRMPTHASLVFVASILRELRSRNLILVSGLAYGIDAQAHRAALSQGIPSVAICPGGLERIYPTQHRDLARDIVDHGGCLVSEHPPEKRAYKSDFLRRNRIIAGWARATWMVEAPMQSGAMSTAHWALKMERDLYATPGHPADFSFQGNRFLISERSALEVWSAHSFGATWPELSALPSEKVAARNSLDRSVLAEIQLRASRFGEVHEWDLQDWALHGDCNVEAFRKSLENLRTRGQILIREGRIVPT